MSPSLDRLGLARTISAIQNGSTPEAAAPFYLADVPPPSITAVTGPPGAGKSTLVDRLASRWAERGHRVAVLAIDPSSPFSGGAVLGDRIRSSSASGHERIFFRSLSARENPDRLLLAIIDSTTALAAHGFDQVVIETVGAGQMNVEALDMADCVVALSVPGLGDEVQLSKAGSLETADIHVVNKADRDGAPRLVSGLEAMIRAAYPACGDDVSPSRYAQPGFLALVRRHGDQASGRGWRPPVLAISALADSGIDGLVDAIGEFFAWLRASGRGPARVGARMRTMLETRLKLELIRRLENADATILDRMAAEIAGRRLDPSTALRRLLVASSTDGPPCCSGGDEERR